MVNNAQPYAGDTSSSPVSGLTLASIICTLVAVIIQSASVMGGTGPVNPAPLVWPISFLAASVVLLAAAIVSLLRRPNFAWQRFFTVAKWVLCMTAVYAFMLLYVFIYDGMRGSALVITVITFIITAVDVPILWGFAVARHERVAGKK